MLSSLRAKDGDYTAIIWTGSVKIASGLKGLKVDPWGFVLPLTPLVWSATLTALLGVLAVLQLLPSCPPNFTMLGSGGLSGKKTFSCIRILLQQGDCMTSILGHDCLNAERKQLWMAFANAKMSASNTFMSPPDHDVMFLSL